MLFARLVSTALVAASAVTATPTQLRRGAKADKVVAYWGNTGYLPDGNIPISTICSNPDVDVVVLSFLTTFPEQTTDGVPVLNFGNACGLTYPNGLLMCPGIADGITQCKAAGKEVFLSLGGAYPHNQAFATADTAKNFADWIWSNFGSDLTLSTTRPFLTSVIDGIDLDIESDVATSQKQAFFPDFITELRAKSGNSWKISAAPQCVVPDAHFSDYIQTSWFDYIFVQLYNTDGCSARDLVNTPSASTNTFAEWVSGALSATTGYANPNVKVFAGLPASTIGSTGDATGARFYLTPNEVKTLVQQFYLSGNFGGISLWDATYDYHNQICGQPYSYWVKKALDEVESGNFTPFPSTCPVSSSSSSSVASSTTSASRSSTSSAVSTTSSASSSKSSSASSSSSSSVVSSSSSSSSSSVGRPSSYPATSSSSSSSVVRPSSSASASSSPSSSLRPSSSGAASSSSHSSAPASTSSSHTSSSAAPVITSSQSSSSSKPAIISSIPSSSHFSSLRPYTNSSSSAPHSRSSGPKPTSSGHAGTGPVPTSSYGGGYGGHEVSSSSSSSAYGGGYGGHEAASSSAHGGGYGGHEVSSSSVYGGGHGKPTATQTSTSTYVDICSTGLTTKTHTWTRTCYEGDDHSSTKSSVPDEWYTTVTVCTVCGAKPTTVTLTKPWSTPASAPAKPTGESWPHGGSGQVTSTLVVIVTPVPESEYWAYISKTQPTASVAPVKGGSDSGSWPASYAAAPKASSSTDAKAVAGSPTNAASWPLGTGSSGSKSGSSYSAQFTGAASKMHVGAGLFAGLAVAALAL